MRRGRRAPAGGAVPPAPDPFWISADVTALIERLLATHSAAAPALDASVAQAVRDRAAGLYLSAPADAYGLSTALIRAIQRQSAALDATTRAIAWRCRAEASLFTGRLPSARRAYERATAEAERADPALLGQILVGRVHLLSLMGETLVATRLARRAERLLQRAGDLVYLAKLYMNRGNVFYQRDRYREAYLWYERAARAFERAGVRDATWVSLLMNQAIACTNLMRIDDARRIFRRTMALCVELNLESLGAHARYNASFLEAAQGDLRAALDLLEHASRTFADQDIEDMLAACARARAEIYLDLGMLREAHTLAGEAVAGFARQGMPMDANLARLVEVRSLLAAGRPAEAAPALAEAALCFRRHRPRRAAVELLRARAALLSSNAGEALARSQRALRVFQALGMLKSAAEARRLAAEARLALGQASRSETILAPILSAASALPIAEQFELAWLTGRIARERGRVPDAIRHFEYAVTRLEALQASIPGVELRARAFERGVRAYHDLFALLIEQPAPRIERLFAVAQSSRARGFRERSGLRQRGLPAPLARERARLGMLTRRLEMAEYPEAGVPDPAAIRNLQRGVRALERRITEPLLRVEPGRHGAGRQHGAIDPARIGRELARDQVLVEYFVAGGRTTAFVITSSAAHWRVLPAGEDDLRERVERVRFHIAAMSLAPADEAGLAFHRQTAETALAALHDALLRPLADLLPAAGRLILVPHRFLHHVPFECLWDGAAYIDARYRITRLPTSALLLRRAEGGARQGRGVAVCGGAPAGLAAVDQELDAVAARFAMGKVAMRRACSTSDLLAALEASRILHISTHGAFRADNPLFSRITTSDGALFLADLLGRRAAADLVVLSACDSGLAFTGNGDDLAGVAHGFLAAGARRLVASLWRIHDVATRDLMDAFYKHYTETARGDAALALSLAGRDVRAMWNHPFYWGSFCVHGT